jgi:glycosyltransferase involved in cell wall biosynthesis
MKFSLVLATVERTQEVSRFLDSLDAQDYRNFELVVVDQNTDARLESLILPFKAKMDIIHLRSERGLSKARNVGLKHVSGDVVGFPDDDCWYPMGVLGFVHDMLAANPSWYGLTGRSEDGHGEQSAGQFDAVEGFVNLSNVWGRGISYTIFLRRGAVDAVGAFDETLGVGAGTRFGAGEESDYLIRCVQRGFGITYTPKLVVFHPNPIRVFDQRAFRRARSYGAGMGRVLRKHGCSSFTVGRALVRPLGGVVLSGIVGRFAKARFHWNVFRGRLDGLMANESAMAAENS